MVIIDGKEWKSIRKLDFNRWVYPRSFAEADRIRKFGPDVVMYLPRGGAGYVQLLCEHLEMDFWQFNPKVIEALIKKFGRLKFLLVDDSVGSGTTFADVQADMPKGVNWQMAVVWADCEYLEEHPDTNLMFMHKTEPSIWYAGWWENVAKIKAGIRNPKGRKSYSQKANPSLAEEISDYFISRGYVTLQKQ